MPRQQPTDHWFKKVEPRSITGAGLNSFGTGLLRGRCGDERVDSRDRVIQDGSQGIQPNLALGIGLCDPPATSLKPQHDVSQDALIAQVQLVLTGIHHDELGKGGKAMRHIPVGIDVEHNLQPLQVGRHEPVRRIPVATRGLDVDREHADATAAGDLVRDVGVAADINQEVSQIADIGATELDDRLRDEQADQALQFSRVDDEPAGGDSIGACGRVHGVTFQMGMCGLGITRRFCRRLAMIYFTTFYVFDKYRA